MKSRPSYSLILAFYAAFPYKINLFQFGQLVQLYLSAPLPHLNSKSCILPLKYIKHLLIHTSPSEWSQTLLSAKGKFGALTVNMLVSMCG